jgi:hypothetical protein
MNYLSVDHQRDMHNRACKAIAALGRTHREVAYLMGVDLSVPPHLQQLPPPTARNIQKAARIIGVSTQWLLTGIPKTEMDFIVSRPQNVLFGQNVITGNSGSAIEINGDTCQQRPENKKNPCLTCKNRYDRETL